MKPKNQIPGGAPLENWRPGAHSQTVEEISKIIGFLVAFFTATTVALMGGTLAIMILMILVSPVSTFGSPAIVALLLATEYFEKNPRKHK